MKFGSAVKTKINASDDSGFKQPDNPYKSKFVLEWLIAISITLLLMTLTITSNITKPIKHFLMIPPIMILSSLLLMIEPLTA
jgi:hypothetical protein